jgi:hypothetical protein
MQQNTFLTCVVHLLSLTHNVAEHSFCIPALVWGVVCALSPLRKPSYLLVVLFTIITCMCCAPLAYHCIFFHVVTISCDCSYSNVRYKSLKRQFCDISVGGCAIHVQCEITFYGMNGRIFLTFLYNIELVTTVIFCECP